jgi:hypothetical protein
MFLLITLVALFFLWLSWRVIKVKLLGNFEPAHLLAVAIWVGAVVLITYGLLFLFG